MPKKHEILTLDGQIHHETKSAYLFSEDGINQVWLPKSQCEWDATDSTMQLPEWLAIEKGIV